MNYKIAFVVVMLITALISASMAQDKFDRESYGLVGGSTGFTYNTGRDLVVDAVSGASTQTDENYFYEPTVNLGIFTDFGMPTSGPGNFGVRFDADVMLPGPYWSFVFMPRYRLQIKSDKRTLKSVNPWMGWGVGFQFVDDFPGDHFISLPLSIGCDFALHQKLYLTTQAEISMINPWGPAWKETDKDSAKGFEAHYNNFMLKIGVAYQFYLMD